MSFFEQAHRLANRQGSGRVDNTTPHLHDHAYFFGTSGHGYLVANMIDCPAEVKARLNDMHMIEGNMAIGEEDCAWSIVMIVAAELHPEANWDAGYGTKIGTPARIEQALKTAHNWYPLELTWILEAMQDSGDQWANYADCLIATLNEIVEVKA